MKKLTLKFGSIKEMLTKDQMKMITGGDFNCTYSGYGSNPYGSIGCATSTGITACECQDLFDIVCSGNNNCNDINCGCK